ncbi:urea amidolyase [Drechmeria coniospora]|uniref:Urea amidolyase n=1 Tax=Drechmeria coniospora TaxID=98403 RepID=A0A151GCI6_DRECN|nr:urea amidolyase [Drechmeria coniospora]KYK54810.1 urea amidolyase [Drechmeria coniospora]
MIKSAKASTSLFSFPPADAMADPAVKRLLIANRGEIASRILKTAARLGYFTISIYTSTDVSSPHATDSHLALPVSSYTDIGEIVGLIREHRVRFVIPGYGFLSENEHFAAAVEEAGAVFVGPTPDLISTFGIKDRARNLAASVGVPTCPGSGLVASDEEAVRAAEKIGYPVRLHALSLARARRADGCLDHGLQICEDESQVRASFSSVVSRGTALFSNPGVFLERYYPLSRHVEVQIFGDGRGDCVAFGERECSIQRRHQKVIEESPSPFVECRPELRKRLIDVSEMLGRTIGYRSAGTIEYLVDDATADFFFLEMNTRLQVEHGITELRFGIDLVELMLGQAEQPLDLAAFKSLAPRGHAIEARVYAENPLKNHMPSPGQLQHVEFAAGPGVRVDTWVRTGTNVSLAYDPLLAKIMAYAPDRVAATATLHRALEASRLQGIVTNADFLRAILEADPFVRGETTTSFLSNFAYTPRAMEFISPGSYTTVQDLPGRVGIGFGIPEGGPMDKLHAQIANCIVGNDLGCELLEITFAGPTIKFHQRAIIAMAGAVADVHLDGTPVSMNARVEAPAGSVLVMGRLAGGCRTYLAVHGGFPRVPVYLGSKSTCPVVEIGGHQGRQLVAGDMLDLSEAGEFVPFTLPTSLIPVWDPTAIHCLSGPHDSPDIMTAADVEAIYSSEWTISHQASRVGVRLHGPQPQWARRTGGEGGSHPSNYLDYPYSMGALNWTGDTSVLFPADAPSLGGFITSHVVPRAELFKVGQLKPGDKFRFRPTTVEAAMELRKRQLEFLEALSQLASNGSPSVAPLCLTPPGREAGHVSTAIIDRFEEATIRQAGDSYILVELLQSLQLDVRCRVQAVAEALDAAKIHGVQLSTPIGCSLLVEYDGFKISQRDLVDKIKAVLAAQLGSGTSARKLASRHIRLPMVFDDKVNKASVERYMATQRPYATYLPDPVEFIARSNGLSSKQEILDRVLSTRILVVGVGFWSGTPIGIPLDPRARLVVPKFNPSRTFSPAGGLGIGGCFFSCDPVDAPGGYVNFGRTLPGWDKFCVNKCFGNRPWLFDNFDQLSFYVVDEDEFESIYSRFQAGKYELEIEHTEFDVDEYSNFCESVAEEAAVFKARQEAATAIEVEAERSLFAQWQEEQKSEKDTVPSLDDIDDSFKIQASMHASIYKIKAQKGDVIKAGDIMVILEAMKMEVNVAASTTQTGMMIQSIVVALGDIVKPGDTLMVLSPSSEPSA